MDGKSNIATPRGHSDDDLAPLGAGARGDLTSRHAGGTGNNTGNMLRNRGEMGDVTANITTSPDRRKQSGVFGASSLGNIIRQGLDLKLWGEVGDDGVGEHGRGACVASTGIPAAGRLENFLYGRLGGVVAGRSWPGIGLTVRSSLEHLDDSGEVSIRACGDWT